MNTTKIKPIPKYMKELIHKKDLKDYAVQDGKTRYYAYLSAYKKHLIKVTVAVKNHRKKWHIKQCAVHGINSPKCLVKDMYFTYIAGYKVGWFYEGLTTYPKWYEAEDWGTADNKYFDVYAPIVNKEYIAKFPQYKYSAYELYEGTNILKYLEIYEKYPQLEYLMKAGFANFAQSKLILNKVGKDKTFTKWLIRNKQVLTSKYYYIDVIIKAFTTGKDINLLQRTKEMKLKFAHDDYYKRLKERFNDIGNYLIQKDVSAAEYTDYLLACDYLHLDMNIEKNRYPHDFKRWHDIRTDEYRTAKALKDAEERAKLYQSFQQVAKKYMPLQDYTKGDYAIIIANSPADLIHEGESLHHCVGRMGYEQKMLREETLIFFIRNKNDVTTPFVTIEYSPRNKKVLQCYGEHDHKPDKTVLNFVNKKWLPYANRQIKKLQIAA